jgi:hypothetical protein
VEPGHPSDPFRHSATGQTRPGVVHDEHIVMDLDRFAVLARPQRVGKRLAGGE